MTGERWWQTWRGTAMLAIAFAVPLMLPRIAPLVDLPTHMARYHVAEAIDRSPELQRFFSFQWHFLPNLGLDLLVIPLAGLIGVEPAVRLLLPLIPVLAVIGMLWIAREAHGGVPATALVALPLAIGFPVTYGFVNYCLAVSLSLLAFGYWLRLTHEGRTGRRDLVFLLVAPIVLTAHVVGYAVLGALCAGSILGRELQSGARSGQALVRAMRSALPLVWPVVVLMLWKDAGKGPPPEGWLDWQIRARWFISILRDRWAVLDLASAAIVYLTAALPLLMPRRFGYAAEIGVPAMILWAAALLLPPTFVTQFASVRLMYVAAAVSVLAVRPLVALPKVFATFGLGFIVARLVAGAVSLTAAGANYDRELAALDHIEPGSFVYALTHVECERHWAQDRQVGMPSVATVRRDVYVNQQFITPEGQLLGFRPGREDLVDYRVSQTTFKPCPRFGIVAQSLAARLASVPPDVDYLWFIDFPAESAPTNASLHLVWRNGTSMLFRRDRAGSRPPG